MTSGYHPQADGQAERNIGTLTRTLSKLSGANQSNWDVLNPYALWAHRTTTHAVTRETPFFLVYGRQITIDGRTPESGKLHKGSGSKTT